VTDREPVPSLLADLALARATADRAEHLRSDEEFLSQAWADPTTRVLTVNRSRFPLTDAADLLWVAPNQVDPTAERLFLGMDGNTAFFAARVGPDDDEGVPSAITWGDLRMHGVGLSDRDAGLAVAAVALDHWHANHPRCARCGEPTGLGNAGWIRRCASCGREHYPRTDPAVIMLAIDDEDRALLGRRADWQPGWFSTLAGFVEAGESAEAAVRRELAEESGVIVDEVTYLGSQPWPFPCSLMLGYHARAVTTDITVDGTEIVEARWFTRDELRAECESGTTAVPPAISIARKIIERWFGGPIPGEWGRS
jgi:NAD+ diphosphatase